MFEGCPHPHWIGDGFCDDENNNDDCSFDGGDCCGSSVSTMFCSECLCLQFATCGSSRTLIGNGVCNDETNNADCNFDGGDCCDYNIDKHNCSECVCYHSETCEAGLHHKWVGDGYCNDETNILQCYFDGGDCCGNCINEDQCSECNCIGGVSDNGLISNILVGNQVCNDETNTPECNYDGGDCCSSPEMVANGFCNDETNTASCLYDGGDCCVNVNTDYCSDCSCVGGVIKSPGFPQNYHNQIDVTWLIQVARAELIQITFQSFDVEWGGSSCK